MSIYEGVIDSIDKVIEDDFSRHPFSHGVTKSNYKDVIGNYLTMSLAFPYLQAGAQLRLVMHYIDNDLDITHGVEVTAAVGAFLTWDELGGHAIVRKEGNAGLPKILDGDQFHANMLRKDIETILGDPLSPNFSKTTKDYLKEISYGLSNVDPVTRVAHMVAFENHAGIMIDALWQSTSKLYDIDKNKLIYFKTHVGGADPAEEYHMQMTKKMIEEVIKEEDIGRFIDFFKKAYSVNYNWCESIKKPSNDE
ncbi:MAG: hypothetical protein JKX92_04940 [Porticoccaceae bacterium]|nr:hypothetical protein [Porticoccaceae bacterium]